MDFFDSCNSCQFWEKVYRLTNQSFFIKEMHLYSTTSMQDWMIDWYVPQRVIVNYTIQ
jgi:hypothetical protein